MLDDRIFIWLRIADAQPIRWCSHIAGNWQESSAPDLASLSLILNDAPFSDAQIIVFVPGEDVFSQHVTLTSAQAKYIHQALSYLVEENITHNIDEMHFILGPKTNPDTHLILGVHKKCLSSWLALLSAHAITPDALYVDSYSLPPASQSVQLWCDAATYMLQLPNGYHLNIDKPLLPILVPKLIQEYRHEALPLCAISADHSATTLELGLPYQPLTTPLSLLLTLSHSVNEGALDLKKLNLLQGEFAQHKAKRRHTHATAIQRWQSVLTLCAALLLIHLSLVVIQGTYLSVKTQQLSAQSVELYKSLFPQDTRIVNVQTQFINQLNAISQTDSTQDFLALLSKFNQSLDAQPKNDNLQVNELNYNAASAQLRIEIAAANFEQLDQLKAHLKKAALQADIDSATTEGNKTKATLRVKPTP